MSVSYAEVRTVQNAYLEGKASMAAAVAVAEFNAAEATKEADKYKKLHAAVTKALTWCAALLTVVIIGSASVILWLTARVSC